MEEAFQKLVDKYNSESDELLKRKKYGEMLDYAEDKSVRYRSYDMGMYVELYKCSATPGERAYVMKHIDEIITDDYQYTDMIIDNFEEFISLKSFLHMGDVIEFDILCLKVLSFFKTRFDRANSGDESYYSLETAKDELGQVIKIITEGDGMSDLGCFFQAQRLKN